MKIGLVSPSLGVWAVNSSSWEMESSSVPSVLLEPDAGFPLLFEDLQWVAISSSVQESPADITKVDSSRMSDIQQDGICAAGRPTSFADWREVAGVGVCVFASADEIFPSPEAGHMYD
ncbi:hypothetical protein I7I50_09997 [Histoplasma capsulatum G186AR]|uniref:Uncharacterized protein n=1 Tax=Ajellomyces capsulatus TaxID=5037 RepID=A0A8H7Z8Q1_AJECA|nr:hypothetical protein I7I52_01235 [Histoplasma capsulatum]QSS68883.1 hypothetical protein I7I50_09997 [Histoplasma capsulatum G186AR]